MRVVWQAMGQESKQLRLQSSSTGDQFWLNSFSICNATSYGLLEILEQKRGQILRPEAIKIHQKRANIDRNSNLEAGSGYNSMLEADKFEFGAQDSFFGDFGIISCTVFSVSCSDF